MPVTTWLELCKGAEQLQEFDRALGVHQPGESLSRRAAVADGATQRRAALPEEAEPAAGCFGDLSDGGCFANSASGLGADYSVRDQGSQGCTRIGECDRGRSA